MGINLSKENDLRKVAIFKKIVKTVPKNLIYILIHMLA